MIAYSLENNCSYITLQVAEYLSGYSETERIEYKQLCRNDSLKAISAFTNTDGGLSKPLLTEDLKREHRSIPRNKLLAQVFYQAGFIEAWGSGTIKIREMCIAQGADEPEFYTKGGGMEVVLYPPPHDTPHDELSSKPHPTLHNKIEISTSQRSLLLVLSGELSRTEIMEKLCLCDRMHFVSSYLEPSLSAGLIERTIPEKLKSKNQKYRLTITGKRLKEKLKRKNKNLP